MRQLSEKVNQSSIKVFEDRNKNVAGDSMPNTKREAIAINEESSDLKIAQDGSWQKIAHT